MAGIVEYENVDSPHLYERPTSEGESHFYSEIASQNRRLHVDITSQNRRSEVDNVTSHNRQFEVDGTPQYRQFELDGTPQYRRLKEETTSVGVRPKHREHTNLKIVVGVFMSLVVFAGMITVLRFAYYYLFTQDNTSQESTGQYTELPFYDRTPRTNDVAMKDCDILGYQHNRNSTFCTRLYNSENRSNWFQANTRCRDDGGQLISIATNEKWIAIQDIIERRQFCWVGLKSRKWLSGETFTTNITFLRFQLNNNGREFAKSLSDCGVLTRNLIRDGSCNSRKISCFICEIIV